MFERIRVNKDKRLLISFLNVSIDYFVTVTPIVSSNCIPDYNTEMYIGVLSLIATMIIISEFDKKGRIISHYWRESNPRQPYMEFENQKLIDLIKKDKVPEDG